MLENDSQMTVFRVLMKQFMCVAQIEGLEFQGVVISAYYHIPLDSQTDLRDHVVRKKHGTCLTRSIA